MEMENNFISFKVKLVAETKSKDNIERNKMCYTLIRQLPLANCDSFHQLQQRHQRHGIFLHCQ